MGGTIRTRNNSFQTVIQRWRAVADGCDCYRFHKKIPWDTVKILCGIIIAALLCFLKTPNPFKYAIKILKCVMNIKMWRSPTTMNTLLLSYKRSCNIPYFAGADGDCSHEIKRHLLLGRKAMTNLDSILKSRDITLLTKVHLVKAKIFPVVMYRCESWTIKKAEQNWCFWTVVLEKTLENPLDYEEIKPVSPQGNQSWIFIGRTGAETETSILWPPDGKNWLIRKDPDAMKYWRREEKGMTEDEMVGLYHRLNGYGFE